MTECRRERRERKVGNRRFDPPFLRGETSESAESAESTESEKGKKQIHASAASSFRPITVISLNSS